MKNICILLFSLFAFLSSYSQLTLQDSLIAHYPMNGNALDVSGNGNHGTPFGAILTTDRFGTPNSAYQFDGVDDYMDLLSNQKFKPQQFPITVTAWIELHDHDFNLVFRNDFIENQRTGIYMSNQDGRTGALYGDGGPINATARRTKFGTSVAPLFTWTHVAIVIRGPLDMDVFFNGNNDCGTYSGTGGNMVYSSNNGNLSRNDGFTTPGSLHFFKGKMDEIRFYNRELSIDEIRTLAGTGNNTETFNVCQGDPVILDALDESSNYSWFPTTGLNCTTCTSPTATPTDTTLYRVIRRNSFSCPDTFFYQVNVQNCNVSVCDPGFTLQDSLVAHYPMDGNALDMSGNGNHGTPFGATLTTDRFGTPNSAYQFDGIDDYMDFLNNQKFKPQLPVTISAWVLMETQGEDVVFRNDYLPNTYDGVWFSIVNSSQGNRVMSAAYGDGGGIGPLSRRTKNGYTSLNLNQWYHVAAVIRGPGDADVFLNGKNDCGFYSGTGGNLSYSGNDGKIGEWYPTGGSGPSNWFDGKLDDIRFYNRELCIREIRELADYNDLQTLNICPGDDPVLDANDGSVAYQWSPTQGLSCTTCANPVANPTDTTLYQVIRGNSFACLDTFYYQVNVQNCNVSVCDPGFTLQDSLVAHYPMDGNALDMSGNGNHGTVMGATLIPDRFGIPNSAYEFDGIDDFIEVLDNQKFKPQLPVTISAWIQLHDYSLNMIFKNDYLENYYHGPWLNCGSGKIAGGIGNGGLAGRFSRNEKSGSTVIPQFTWTHVAVVIRSGLDIDIYINGVNDCGVYHGNGNNTLAYSQEDGAIGLSDSNAPTGPVNWFNGKMDEIRFYNRELCIREIRELADFNNMETVNICSGDSTSLDANDGSTTYQWSPTQGLSCTTCPNPTANPTDTTLYQVIRDNGFACLDTFFFQVNPDSCSVSSRCDTTILDADFEYSSNGLVLTLINASRGPDSGIDEWIWDFGDGNRRRIFQADTITHQYFQPGTYDVCLFVTKFYDELNVCNDTLCQTVMIDSISSGFGENLQDLGWNIYPNPASETIFLERETSDGRPVEVEIVSLRGKVIFRKSLIISHKNQIPISFLPKGMYILKVKDDAVHGYWKFIKE